jgi:hypothetical protein
VQLELQFTWLCSLAARILLGGGGGFIDWDLGVVRTMGLAKCKMPGEVVGIKALMHVPCPKQKSKKETEAAEVATPARKPKWPPAKALTADVESIFEVGLSNGEGMTMGKIYAQLGESLFHLDANRNPHLRSLLHLTSEFETATESQTVTDAIVSCSKISVEE